MSGIFDAINLNRNHTGILVSIKRDGDPLRIVPGDIPSGEAHYLNADSVPITVETSGGHNYTLSPGQIYVVPSILDVRVVEKPPQSHTERRTDKDVSVDTPSEKIGPQDDSDALLHAELVKKIDRLYDEKFKLRDRWVALEHELEEVQAAIASIDQSLAALSYTNGLKR